jgi:hypothetical protein
MHIKAIPFLTRLFPHRKAIRALVQGLAPLGIVVPVMFSCSSFPFWPDTGEPVSVVNSPQDVINKLLRSYETKSITDFESILPTDNSFRFYVCPVYFQDNPNGILLAEHIDSGFTYILQGDYHYRRQDDEQFRHEKLFDKANSITFTTRPTVNLEDFIYHFGQNGDTLGIEAKMTGGSFTVEYEDLDEPGVVQQQPVNIEQQVFYLIKGADGGWLMSKWFDMGTTPNSA